MQLNVMPNKIRSITLCIHWWNNERIKRAFIVLRKVCSFLTRLKPAKFHVIKQLTHRNACEACGCIEQDHKCLNAHASIPSSTSLLTCYSRSINLPSKCSQQLSAIRTYWFRRRIGTTVPATVVLIHHSCYVSNFESRITEYIFCEIHRQSQRLGFSTGTEFKNSQQVLKKKCSNINHFGWLW